MHWCWWRNWLHGLCWCCRFLRLHDNSDWRGRLNRLRSWSHLLSLQAKVQFTAKGLVIVAICVEAGNHNNNLNLILQFGLDACTPDDIHRYAVAIIIFTCGDLLNMVKRLIYLLHLKSIRRRGRKIHKHLLRTLNWYIAKEWREYRVVNSVDNSIITRLRCHTHNGIVAIAHNLADIGDIDTHKI